ncbi:MAG: hypothetical protein MZU97_23440 [Bacillus subtilis]|nr:hypothetical protein [Bacillus subtilis]
MKYHKEKKSIIRMVLMVLRRLTFILQGMNKVDEKRCKAVFEDFDIAPGVHVEYLEDYKKKKVKSRKKIQFEVVDYENTCQYHLIIKANTSHIVTSSIELIITPLENPRGYAEFWYLTSNDQKVIEG